MRPRPRHVLPSRKELSVQLFPIARRMPSYVRLGWAVAREPSIPWIHRSGLYATVVYIFSPAHLAMNAIPILGQMDVVLMLLLSLRQALNHCPQSVLEKLYVRLRMEPDQLRQDIATLTHLARLGVEVLYDSASAKVPGMVSARSKAQFTGRVASGFTRRMAARMKNTSQS